jgi:hypothetical protein
MREIALEFADSVLVALIEYPLFDSQGSDEARLRENLQVLACSGLAHAEFVRDEYTANAVFDQVAIDLRGKEWES